MAKLDFKTAFKYPFNRAKGLWTILWVLLPILGWFALMGYGVRIIQGFSKGKFKKLPIFKFSSNLKLGFFMFLKSLPFLFVYIVFIFLLTIINPWLRLVNIFTGLFVLPILFINFMNKETMESLFEFKIINSVFNNFKDYIITLLKDISLAIIFFIMWIVLVGIPAGAFTKSIFLADFYRRKVK